MNSIMKIFLYNISHNKNTKRNPIFDVDNGQINYLNFLKGPILLIN